nr:hypothetical protein [Brevundimonas diminuta]
MGADHPDRPGAVVPGEVFGLSPYIRLSYAAAIEDLDEALARIKASCGRLTWAEGAR